LPGVSVVVKKLLLVQPSSAMAERILSVLEFVTKQQGNALEDNIEYRVMRMYHSRKWKPKKIFTSEGRYDLEAGYEEIEEGEVVL